MKRFRVLHCGFTDDTINLLGKNILRTQSNRWISEETPFSITGGQERNILGNNSLLRIGIEVKQKKCRQPICSVNQPQNDSKWHKPYLSSDQNFSIFKKLFTRVGRFSNDRKITHFHNPVKPVQAKRRRVPHTSWRE